MLTIGHRGAMGYAPENTLLSVRKAIELGADCVEVDVYLVGKTLVVIHDPTLDRTTDGKGKLDSHSFAELRALDAGQGQQIPTLQEVIDVTKGKVGLNVELKGAGMACACVKLVNTLVEAEKQQILLSSFLMGELAVVSQLDVSLNIGVLASKNIDDSFVWAGRLKAFSIHLNERSVTPSLIERAHFEGLKLYVYTVNGLKDIERMKNMGVDGVFSNYPDRVLAACSD